MATYSTVVTLDNLNTVYKDLRDRIGSISNIYHVKGNIYWSDLLKLYGEDKVSIGTVYNLVIDAFHSGPKQYELKDGEYKELEAYDARFYNGINVLCIKVPTNDLTSTVYDWETYWQVLDSFLEEATDTSVGVIKTGSNIKTAADTKLGNAGGNVELGLKLYSSTDTSSETDSAHDHRAYIEIPVATTSTYGVVTNQAQEIGGDKTLNGALSVAGQLNLKGNDPVVTNSIQASKIVLDGVTISASNGVITFA